MRAAWSPLAEAEQEEEQIEWSYGQAQSPGHAISSLSLSDQDKHTPHCLPQPPQYLVVRVCVCGCVLLCMDRQFSLCKAKRVEGDRKININAPHTRSASAVQCSASAVCHALPYYRPMPRASWATYINNQLPIPISFPLPHKILKIKLR